MKYTKKWMVVPYVEEEETDKNYSNLEKIIRQNNITDEQKADLYNNNFKKIINQSNVNEEKELNNMDEDQIQKLKLQFEQVDLDSKKEIDILKDSINSLLDKNNTSNESFYRPTFKSTRIAKKRRINADESVILKSKFKKNFLNAPKKPNNGIKSKKTDSRNINWVHNDMDNDIQNLANDISMINMN